MLFAMVLLFFDVHIGIINLLPNWLSYLILAYCAKKIMEDKGGLTAAIGIISAVLQIVYFFLKRIMPCSAGCLAVFSGPWKCCCFMAWLRVFYGFRKKRVCGFGGKYY